MELAYGKKELEQIAKLYGIKGAYKMKKAELTAALVEAIPTKLPEMLPMLDEIDLIFYEALFSEDELLEYEYQLEDYYNLMELELVQIQEIEGAARICAVDLVKEAYLKLDKAAILEQVKHNFLIREFIISALNLYGLVKLDWAVELYNRYHEEATSKQALENMVKKDMRLACQCKIMEDYIVEETIYALDKGNFKDFLAESREKEYFLPSKELLEQMRDERFYEPTLQVERLKAYLKANFLESDGDIEEAVTAITMMARVDCDKTGRTMELMLEELSNLGIAFNNLAEINELIKRIVPVINTTRKWINKGYTEEELSPHSFDGKTGRVVKLTDVGRNDPCPCKSGKKYKKCCGK